MDSLSLELVIGNRLSEIDRVNKTFNAFSQQNELPDSVRRAFNLVFDELLNNIISYAFPDNGRHLIEIRISGTDKHLNAVIEDDGIPFNLLEVEEPELNEELAERKVGGLGIHLVKRLMDDVQYKRHEEKNRITLTKYIEELD